jgi:DNA-binding MltR family transcriptional regulator
VNLLLDTHVFLWIVNGIIGATFLEMLLENILREFLIDEEKRVTEELFDGYKPLSTFSSKITMAYCLGLIYKSVHDDLHLIRKIRNEFAH